MSGRWAMVGRNAELSRALETLSRPNTDRGSVLFVGPQGSGKTRLLLEVVEALGDRVLLVQIFGTQTHAASPFAAWHRFRPAPSLGLDRADVMRHIAARMASQARGRPIVIAADDAHLLDGLSVALLHQLVATGTVKLVGTLRTDEDPIDRLATLHESGLVERVPVEPLSFEATWELLAQVLAGPVEERTARRLWEVASGKPLTIRQVVVPSLFVRERGLWRLPAEVALPTAGDADLAASRIERLSKDTREVLELVLLGEPVGLLALTKLTSVAAVEQAEVEGFIRVVRDGRRNVARLTHPIYREVLRARQIPDDRRTHALQSLAGVVQSTGMRRADDPLRMATWLLDGGGPFDADLLTTAAMGAYATFDHPLARRLAETALREGAGQRAATVLALVLGSSGEGEEAMAVLDRARPSSALERVEWALARSMVAFNALGQVEAPQAVRDAIVEAGTDAGGLAAAVAGAMDAYAGAHEAAYAHLRKVEDDSGAMPAARLFATAMTLAIEVQRGLGVEAVDQIVDVMARALRQGGGTPFLRTGLEYGRWVTAQVTGEIERLIPRAQGHATYDVVATLATAVSRRLRGRVRDAQSAALEAAILAGRNGLLFQAVSLAEAAQACALLGERADAERTIAEALRVSAPVAAGMHPWLALAHAQVQASAGELDAAAATLHELIEGLREDGFVGVELVATHALARYDRVTPAVAEAATRVAGMVPGLYPEAVGLHVTGLATGDAAAVGGAVERYGRLGLHLYVAEAIAHRERILRAAGSPETDIARNHLGLVLARLDARHTPALLPYL